MNIFQEIFVGADPRTAELIKSPENVSPNCASDNKKQISKIEERKTSSVKRTLIKNTTGNERDVPSAKHHSTKENIINKNPSQTKAVKAQSVKPSTADQMMNKNSHKTYFNKKNDKSSLEEKINELEKQLTSIKDENEQFFEANIVLQKNLDEKKKILLKKEKECFDFECEYQDRLQEIEEQNEFRYRELLTRGSSLH